MSKKIIIPFLVLITLFLNIFIITAVDITDRQLIITNNIFTGNVSFLDTNASTGCSGSEYLAGNGTCVSVSLVDTNETTRFNTLVGTDCGAGNYSYGFDNDGLIQCRLDTTSAGGETKKGDGTYIYNDSTIIYFNSSYAGINLEVNGSDYWDDYDTANSTWFQNIAGALSLKLTQLTTWADTWLGTKDTDDLTEGSTNLYDNQTWNETRATSLFADISVTGDNSTWNETHANTLYSTIDEPLWTANQSSYYTSAQVEGFNYYNSTSPQPISDVWVNVSGDTMTGNLEMNNNNVTNHSHSTFCNGANCWKMYVNASDYFIIEEI